jgi:hypothetical protein
MNATLVMTHEPPGNKPVAPRVRCLPRYQPSPKPSSSSTSSTRSAFRRVSSSAPRASKSSVSTSACSSIRLEELSTYGRLQAHRQVAMARPCRRVAAAPLRRRKKRSSRCCVVCCGSFTCPCGKGMSSSVPDVWDAPSVDHVHSKQRLSDRTAGGRYCCREHRD